MSSSERSHNNTYTQRRRYPTKSNPNSNIHHVPGVSLKCIRQADKGEKYMMDTSTSSFRDVKSKIQEHMGEMSQVEGLVKSLKGGFERECREKWYELYHMDIQNDVCMDLLFRGVKRQHGYMEMSGKIENGSVFEFTSSLLQMFMSFVEEINLNIASIIHRSQHACSRPYGRDSEKVSNERKKETQRDDRIEKYMVDSGVTQKVLDGRYLSPKTDLFYGSHHDVRVPVIEDDGGEGVSADNTYYNSINRMSPDFNRKSSNVNQYNNLNGVMSKTKNMHDEIQSFNTFGNNRDNPTHLPNHLLNSKSKLVHLKTCDFDRKAILEEKAHQTDRRLSSSRTYKQESLEDYSKPQSKLSNWVKVYKQPTKPKEHESKNPSNNEVIAVSQDVGLHESETNNDLFDDDDVSGHTPSRHKINKRDANLDSHHMNDNNINYNKNLMDFLIDVHEKKSNRLKKSNNNTCLKSERKPSTSSLFNNEKGAGYLLKSSREDTISRSKNIPNKQSVDQGKSDNDKLFISVPSSNRKYKEEDPCEEVQP